MRSLYFLAQAKNQDKFNSLFDRENMLVTTFCTEEIPSLTAFVMRDKVVAQQDLIMIDVGTVETWSDAHILSAVQHLRRFSNAKLIFLGEDTPAVTELFGILAAHHHIEDLIIDRADVDLEAEFQKCLAGRPRLADKMQLINTMLAQQAVKVTRPLDIPPGLVVYSAVAGTMARCGTTTQAFAVYHYLKSLGFRPAVLDKLGTTLPLLMQYEEYERGEDDIITIRGVNFTTNESPSFDAYVIDYGVLTAETAPLFCKADLSVLVGCTKPWELPAFAEAIRLLSGYTCTNFVTLASFSTPEELDKLTKYLGGSKAVVPYYPDFWSPPAGTAYAGILLPVIKEICGVTHEIEPEVE